MNTARRSRNEAGKTDRKIDGQKNGIPVYLSVPYSSVSRFPRSLRAISTIAVQMNLKKAVKPTQRRKGAETQGLRLMGTTTCWGSHLDLPFPRHLLVLRVFASWRLCVNRRVQQGLAPFNVN
jgi:hypothetical protein